MGFFLAADDDKEVGAEAKATLERVVGRRIRDTDNDLGLSKVKHIAHLVAECIIVKTKKKGFLTVLFRAEEGL